MLASPEAVGRAVARDRTLTHADHIRLVEVAHLASDNAVTLADLRWMLETYLRLVSRLEAVRREATADELDRLANLPGSLGLPALGPYTTAYLRFRARALRRPEGHHW